MSDTSERYGPALAEWIDTLRGDQSVRSFAMTHGLDPARVHAWANGATPSMPQLRSVADGLDVSLGTVLAAAGMAREDELTVVKGDTAPPPSIDAAIAGDPTLEPFERDFLRNARDLARQARPDNEHAPPKKRQRHTTEVRSHRSNGH
jgi:hypothetical protein